jgi:shikimate 5-dehydrogenase
LRANVLGAGGVARAVVAGLADCGADVTVYNRSAARARALAAEFDCHHELWERRTERTDARLLVNCTSVGMWPDVEAIPMPADRLDGELTVFDTVYNPVETRLLRDAARGGCRTVDGLTMFVNQAAAQFRLWTGQDADKAFMRRIVEERLA